MVAGSEQSSKSKGVIVGIAVGCGVLFVALAGAAAYAFIQRRRAEKAKEELGGPFGTFCVMPCSSDSTVRRLTTLYVSTAAASWARSEERGGAPRLKGARWFSYEELKRSTNNFAEANELGYGGYGKVYRGMLPTGQFIAIKRAQQGSMQGGHEFKTEIELLSRVHHKNLVGLLGFCFEQGEQMLVYEFMSGGTLRDSLAGKDDGRLFQIRIGNCMPALKLSAGWDETGNCMQARAGYISTGRSGSGWRLARRAGWPTSTSSPTRQSSTGTSSPATSSWTSTSRPRSPTSASPS
jgi:hypothetical protein